MARTRRNTKAKAPAATRMTTAEAALGALLAHGLDTIYALPGVHNDDFFDALARTAQPGSAAAQAFSARVPNPHSARHD